MFTIGAFSTQLGVSPGTLRKWEERYGFPTPVRSAGGTRLYTADDLARMRKAVRLIAQGMRPSTVFAQIEHAATPQTDASVVAVSPAVSDLVRCLLSHDPAKMRRALERELFERGVTDFVESIAAPLMLKVGELWQQGALHVFSEHAVSCLMESALHEATPRLRSEFASPRILLSTPPSEQHRLGLAMVRSVMCAAGAKCIDLGSELPLDELCRAADAYRADIVGISISPHTKPRYGVRFLQELRERLPTATEVWAGGAGVAKMATIPPGVQIFADLRAVKHRIEEFRDQSATLPEQRPQ